MVTSVVGHPDDNRALHRHLAAAASEIFSGRLALNEPWVK